MDFSFWFYRQVTAQEPGKSIFFSLVTIPAAFALLALGSRAMRQAQVLEELAFNLTDTQEDPPLSFSVAYFNSGSYTCDI